MARTRLASHIEAAVQQWIWPNRLPAGEFTIWSGDPECGKSVALSDIAARITTGRALPGCEEIPAVDGGVVWITGEERADAHLRPRFEAMQADLDRIVIIDDDGDGIDLVDDLEQIIQAAEDVQAKLIVVDTLLRCLRVHGGDYQETNRALAPILRFLRSSGATCPLLNHHNKSPGRAKTRSLGSIGILGLARSALISAPDPASSREFRFILAPAKGNLGRAPAIRYRTVMLPSGVIVCEWGSTDAEISVDELVAASTESRSAVETAAAAILTILAHEPIMARDLPDRIKDHDPLAAKASIYRARSMLAKQGQIRRQRIGQGVNAFVVWYRPEHIEAVLRLIANATSRSFGGLARAGDSDPDCEEEELPPVVLDDESDEPTIPTN